MFGLFMRQTVFVFSCKILTEILYMRRSIKDQNLPTRNLALFSENSSWYNLLPSPVIPTTDPGQRTDFLQEDKWHPDEPYCSLSVVIMIITLRPAVSAPQSQATQLSYLFWIFCIFYFLRGRDCDVSHWHRSHLRQVNYLVTINDTL